MNFITKHKTDIVKAIVAIAPPLGVSGLAYDQHKELEQYRTTVVVESEPVEVNITQPVTVRGSSHTHKEFNHSHDHEALDSRIKHLEGWH